MELKCKLITDMERYISDAHHEMASANHENIRTDLNQDRVLPCMKKMYRVVTCVCVCGAKGRTRTMLDNGIA